MVQYTSVPATPRWLPVLAAGIIMASSLLIGWLVWQYGPFVSSDTERYFSSVNGPGFFRYSYYDPALDLVFAVPQTAHAPLLSIIYGIPVRLGVPFDVVLVAVAASTWAAFLVGTGLLTYRLSGSPWLALSSIVIAALTTAYLDVFQMAMAEVIFLPLLVWSLLALSDLPQQPRVMPRLLRAVLLLALLLLARYSGVFILGAVGLWWGWWRLQQGRVGRLLYEWPVLALAAGPLALWLLRNAMVTSNENTLNNHLEGSDQTFWQGVEAVFAEGAQLGMPALPSAIRWPMPFWVAVVWRYCRCWSGWCWCGVPTPLSHAALCRRVHQRGLHCWCISLYILGFSRFLPSTPWTCAT
ncbi:MAG: hypothetical protein HC876_12085 [Chloroflexaceae bacterium]|nr:hypothetical protein [Chloroflexaceae bacterium]